MFRLLVLPLPPTATHSTLLTRVFYLFLLVVRACMCVCVCVSLSLSLSPLCAQIMSFATFHYLPNARRGRAMAHMDTTSRLATWTPPDLHRRPLRVTSKALPELIDIIVRAVDDQLPAACTYSESVVRASAKTREAQGEGTNAQGGKSSTLRRLLSSPFSVWRTESSRHADVVSPSSSSSFTLHETEATARTHEQQIVTARKTTRFYLHFPGLDVETRPGDNDDDDDDDHSTDATRQSGAPTRSERLTALIHAAVGQTERLTQAYRTRRRTARPRSPSVHSLSEDTSSPTENGLVPSDVPAHSVPRLSLPTRSPSVTTEDTNSTNATLTTMAKAKWTVTSRDPWDTAVRRPGPDEVGLELRVRACRVVTFASAPSAGSGLSSWLSPIVRSAPARSVPLMEWVLPIIETAASRSDDGGSVTFLELDPYSQTFVPVTAMASVVAAHDMGCTLPELPTRKLFCNNVEDVRCLLNFLVSTCQDAAALGTFSLHEAAAAGGPRAVAEIKLDVQVMHKKSFL